MSSPVYLARGGGGGGRSDPNLRRMSPPDTGENRALIWRTRQQMFVCFSSISPRYRRNDIGGKLIPIAEGGKEMREREKKANGTQFYFM